MKLGHPGHLNGYGKLKTKTWQLGNLPEFPRGCGEIKVAIGKVAGTIVAAFAVMGSRRGRQDIERARLNSSATRARVGRPR